MNRIIVASPHKLSDVSPVKYNVDSVEGSCAITTKTWNKKNRIIADLIR